jgi:hypothetical protein
MSRLRSLLDLASFAQHIEAEFVAELSPQEREAVGTPDDWAAKDLVAHLTTWRERAAEGLKADHHAPPQAEPEEFDEVNRAIFDQNYGQSWEGVLLRAKEAWLVFTKNLGDLTEDLLAASADGAQAGRPLWRRVTVDAGNHPVLHYAEFARRRGGGASATRWMEAVSPLLVAVDPSGEWHGVVHYNLACHYAQTGMKDNALNSLRISLELNPGLTEWSRQDSDLAPLHTDPRFSSLIGSES